LCGQTLGEQQGSEANCPKADWVQGPHYFLILRQEPDGRWLLAPLYSGNAAGSEPLDNALKGGSGNRWRNDVSYFHPDQFWLVHSGAILAAQFNDNSTQANRRTYATNNPAEIERVIGLKRA
jgi:hypothetical protein